MRPIVIMGVSGCGKSTVGRLLAVRIGAAFHDGDDYHPPANIAKMRSGVPLDDVDRADWLRALNDLMRAAAGQPLVVACSALRESHRVALGRDLPAPPVFVYLRGSQELLHERLAGRAGHFMPAGLLRSQLDTLEEPVGAIVVPISLTPEAQVETILEAL